MIIKNYDAFVDIVEQYGFILLSHVDGFPSVGDMTTDAQWHTGDADTDPWQWKDRVTSDGKAAYIKTFSKRPGFISRKCLPWFIAAKRDERTLEQRYADGEIGILCKRLYDVLQDSGALATHQWKQAASLSKEDRKRFDNEVAFLMDELLVTTCGNTHKISKQGVPYGWGVTVFDLLDRWAGEDLMREAYSLRPHIARAKILEQAAKIAPNLEEKERNRILGL